MLLFPARRIFLFSGVLFFYLLMAFGGFFSFLSDSLLLSVACFLIVGGLSFLYLLQNNRADITTVSLFFSLATMFLSVGALRSDDPLYAFEKFDALVIVTIVAFVIAAKLIRSFGQDRFWRCFIGVALVVLLLTLIFKANFGFFDRSVRYFINGPIVFGWLMGFSALVSYMQYLKGNRYSFLLVSGVFAVAVVWTLSKGPLLALLVASLYVSLADRRGRVVLIVAFFLFVAVFGVFFDQIWTFLLESRFSAFLRVVQPGTAASDWGSVGIRQAMFFDSLQKIVANPALGIGLGNYHYEALFYPHNEHLEVFLELGVFAGVVHLAAVLWLLCKSNMEYRAMMIFFLVCSSFSGDMGYLRFVYVLGFLGVTFVNKPVMSQFTQISYNVLSPLKLKKTC